MSRLSFRPRPLDINKKLPVLKSLKDVEDDDVPSSTRNSQLLRLASDPETFEVQPTPSKKVASEIPTPQFVFVDTYERDYTRTFTQPASYLRRRGVRAEIGEFVEYDLDNEDEDWLQDFNKEANNLAAEKLEAIIYKLEVLDHKARERAGIITPTLSSAVPVILTFDAAVEALQSLSIRYGVFQSVYNYWKEKRKQWQKPVLRRLQPPPPVNDTNPYNVFRPREKAHRFHTRRMQRRENNVQSFEKLRQVRRNLDQAKAVLDALIKREEKKRDLVDNEVALQRIQMKYKVSIFPESRHLMVPVVNPQQDPTRRFPHNNWLQKLDPNEPVMLFTKSLVPDKLSAAGIVPPIRSSTSARARGRIGRGGRIVFDRWNPLSHTLIDYVETPSSILG